MRNKDDRIDVLMIRKNAGWQGRYQNCEIWFCAPSVFSAGAALVERFARRVVDRRADDLHVERTVHFYDLGMSSADQQAEERKVGVRKLSVGQVQKVGEDVPLQMIDLHQRNVVGDRESFGERYAHQERSQQAGAARESDRVDLVDRHAGLFQGRIDYRDDILLVGPGC